MGMELNSFCQLQHTKTKVHNVILKSQDHFDEKKILGGIFYIAVYSPLKTD